MTCNVADVHQSILVRDWNIYTIRAELSSYSTSLLGGVVDDNGVGDSEVEAKVFDISIISFQLM